MDDEGDAMVMILYLKFRTKKKIPVKRLSKKKTRQLHRDYRIDIGKKTMSTYTPSGKRVTAIKSKTERHKEMS